MNPSTATTAELVAFYNKHAAKPVTKFADRKTAERRVATLLADLKFTKKPAPKGTDRGASIAASWQNKKVAAARAARHGVVVRTPDGKTAQHKSVREAFMVLAPPLGQHIRFRGALKASGHADFSGYKFKLVG
jgi:hypothetical protein